MIRRYSFGMSTLRFIPAGALLVPVALASGPLSPQQQRWIATEVDQKLYGGQASVEDLMIWESMVADGYYKVLPGEQHAVLPGPDYEPSSGWTLAMCIWFKDGILAQAADCRSAWLTLKACEDWAAELGLEVDNECQMEQPAVDDCRSLKNGLTDAWLDNCGKT